MLDFKLHKLIGGQKLDLSLKLSLGQIVLLSGPSGGGKTTLLRTLAGLNKADQGFINYDKIAWYNSQKGIHLPIQERRVGMVFQQYALFPHLSVLDNLQFAKGKEEEHYPLEQLLSHCGLEQLTDRLPKELSGGQQQRLALARSLVRPAKLLLLDEPFAAQDLEHRQKMIGLLQAYHAKYQPIIILTSHDTRELDPWVDQHYSLVNGCLELQERKKSNPVRAKLTGWSEQNGQLVALLELGQHQIQLLKPPIAWQTLSIGSLVEIPLL